MEKTSILTLVLGSATIGACMSGVILAISSWHHRRLKKRFDKEHLTDDLEKDFSDFIHQSHKDL
jgi:hypothetical protein